MDTVQYQAKLLSIVILSATEFPLEDRHKHYGVARTIIFKSCLDLTPPFKCPFMASIKRCSFHIDETTQTVVKLKCFVV